MNCGCHEQCTCGCCEGTRTLTPATIYNRPGLPTLLYRVGTHGQFLQSMKARLSSSDYPALEKLKTRDPSDFSIALLDGWATVGDVLSFYQERIANEGYLRTATERRSVLGIARLIGYAPRPGVSATVYLAYTLDKDQNVTIGKGNRAQSVPGPGELPQSFETFEDLEARVELNAIRPRLSKPQYITLENLNKTLYVQGIASNLKIGDILLLNFSEGSHALARLKEVETDPLQNHTALRLDVLGPTLAVKARTVVTRFIKFTDFDIAENNTTAKSLARKMNAASNPLELLDELKAKASSTTGKIANWLNVIVTELEALSPRADEVSPARVSRVAEDTQLTVLAGVVGGLLKPASLPPASSRALERDISKIYAPESDQFPRMFGALYPALRGSTYLGYANTTANLFTPLASLEVMRVRASLFGHNIPALELVRGRPQPLEGGRTIRNTWSSLNLSDATAKGFRSVALDAEYSQIKKDDWIVIQRPQLFSGDSDTVYAKVSDMQTRSLSAYAVSSKVTVLTLDRDWLPESIPNGELSTDPLDANGILDQTNIYVASEALALANEPITLEIAKDGQVVNEQSQDLELDALYQGLESGRWVIVYGERTDIPNTSGVYGAELMMIASVEHRFAQLSNDGKTFFDLPKDTRHTFVHFAEPLEYTYKRDTVVLYANVVKATHGETKLETLGAGDASKSFQTFMLKQPPLTYLAAPTAAGAESTLELRVNSVAWHEAPYLTGLKPTDRNYQIRIEDDGKTSVIFGDGKQGARLPTGLENVTAKYRSGIGKPGNVAANQVSLLTTKPLGVKEVINPLAATGGADRESRDTARKNAPKAVKALDRLVSVQDYADFAESFAGIGKASSTEISYDGRSVVHVTMAGIDDVLIAESSDLYRNLYRALRDSGDPYQSVELALRELKLLVIAAKVRILPDYLWEEVEPRIRATMLDKFGFEKRNLGQDVLQAEVLSSLQLVEGVAYVDLETLAAVGDTELSQLNFLKNLQKAKRILVDLAHLNNKQGDEPAILPAQLAILSPQVKDTLILTVIP